MSHQMTDGIPTGWKAENGMHILTSIVDRVFKAFAAYDRLVLELFAGPGGMSEAIKMAGIPERQVLGVEWDASACMTAVRAGHPRLHADLTLLDPRIFGKVWGFHGSPSCQGFSMAGKGESRGDADLLLQAIRAMGRTPERADEIMAKTRELAKSPLSSLSLEPLRYILALRPEWITLEQVRAVLPLWEAYAVVLRGIGYNVWTGKVHSEQYGVPQTRERAVLLASLSVDVSGGMLPTHSKFHTHKSKRGQLDEDVLPYVTMAQALQWGMTERPYVTVAAGTKAGGVDPQALGGSAARAIVHGERKAGHWVEQPVDHPRATLDGSRHHTHQRSNYNTGSSSLDPAERDRGIRTLDEPSSTITTKGFQWATHMGDVRNAHGAVRSVDEPSATITSSMDNGNFQWVANPAAMRAQLEAHPERVNNQSGEDFDLAWPAEQPSPVVAGRGLVGMPGANGNRFNGSKKSRNDGVRVTVAEAGILQSFPADYPWTGNLTKQYEQVGNAVPPLLGQAMVETVLGIRQTARKAA